jgi:hypothetical protein
MTAETIRAHIEMLRQFDPAYAEYARGWYWDLLGGYMR